MLEEKYFEFSETIPKEEALSGYDELDYDTMINISDEFVGFATAPCGIYNHEMFEVKTYKFADEEELNSIVNDGEDKLLFYVTDSYIRFATV